MRERPIIFSGAMVRAILAGSKTQTRRVSLIDDFETTSHPDGITTWRVNFSKAVKGVLGSYSGTHCTDAEAQRIIASQFCPYGSVGDRLWVRETWGIALCGSRVPLKREVWPDGWPTDSLRYAADRTSLGSAVVRSPIHMPRWASRITLEITDVRVERLQDISAKDALAEGVMSVQSTEPGLESAPYYRSLMEPAELFRMLWESINGPGSWDANPWVWAITFKRVEAGRG